MLSREANRVTKIVPLCKSGESTSKVKNLLLKIKFFKSKHFFYSPRTDSFCKSRLQFRKA